MKLSDRVKPISYLKAHAPDVLRELPNQEPLLITVRGEVKAVLLDIRAYEKSQETMALLKLLALGEEDIRVGRVRLARDAFATLRKRKRR